MGETECIDERTPNDAEWVSKFSTGNQVQSEDDIRNIYLCAGEFTCFAESNLSVKHTLMLIFMFPYTHTFLPLSEA